MKRQNRMIGILFVSLVLFTLAVPSTGVNAAGRTGKYERHFVGERVDSYRTIVIKSIKKKKVRFQMGYARSYPCVDDRSNVITGIKKGNKVTFQYSDSWNSSGTGTMKLYKNYIKIKTFGNGYLSTDGKWFKIKRISNSKKLN